MTTEERDARIESIKKRAISEIEGLAGYYLRNKGERPIPDETLDRMAEDTVRMIISEGYGNPTDVCVMSYADGTFDRYTEGAYDDLSKLDPLQPITEDLDPDLDAISAMAAEVLERPEYADRTENISSVSKSFLIQEITKEIAAAGWAEPDMDAYREGIVKVLDNYEAGLYNKQLETAVRDKVTAYLLMWHFNMPKDKLDKITDKAMENIRLIGAEDPSEALILSEAAEAVAAYEFEDVQKSYAAMLMKKHQDSLHGHVAQGNFLHSRANLAEVMWSDDMFNLKGAIQSSVESILKHETERIDGRREVLKKILESGVSSPEAYENAKAELEKMAQGYEQYKGHLNIQAKGPDKVAEELMLDVMDPHQPRMPQRQFAPYYTYGPIVTHVNGIKRVIGIPLAGFSPEKASSIDGHAPANKDAYTEESMETAKKSFDKTPVVITEATKLAEILDTLSESGNNKDKNAKVQDNDEAEL